MSLIVFVVVLGAAVLHAGWNGLVKHSGDKFLSMSAVVLGHVPFAVALLMFSPMPDASSWVYIVSGALLHTGYQLFLLYSYRIGDLTQVYPIARGVAPLIVAFVSVVFLGVHLKQMQLLGILAIGVGIMSLVIVRGGAGLSNRNAGFMAVATGCFIAAYSLNDGMGARLAGTAFGFFGWLSILNALSFFGVMWFLQPSAVKGVVGKGRKMAVIGGGGSFFAYALVTWAFTQAPIALVTALRETSIVFALLIGIVFLKERVDLAKVISVALSMFGAVLLRMAR